MAASIWARSAARRRHDGVVAGLVKAYREVPAGTRVRLGKRTSNLFRFGTPDTEVVHLDTAGLAGVIEVDRAARTADVQGMCTYEDLVEATLPFGLMPLGVLPVTIAADKFGAQTAVLGSSIALLATCSGVIGKCGDMVGVWIDPVTAHVMMTLREAMKQALR